MHQRHNGPGFMQPHFYHCPDELKNLLPEHNIHQGIQCTCGNKYLVVRRRAQLPAVFAHCISCGCKFNIYVNDDYPAGYIQDDPTKPVEPIACNNCGEQAFQVAVGYEYPGDEIDSTDITWFTMVGKCANCGTGQELFTDETG